MKALYGLGRVGRLEQLASHLQHAVRRVERTGRRSVEQLVIRCGVAQEKGELGRDLEARERRLGVAELCPVQEVRRLQHGLDHQPCPVGARVTALP